MSIDKEDYCVKVSLPGKDVEANINDELTDYSIDEPFEIAEAMKKQASRYFKWADLFNKAKRIVSTLERDYEVWYAKAQKKVREVLVRSMKEMIFIVPVFFLAVLVSVLIELYIPDQIISNLLGKNLLIAIPLAAVLGIILPISRYATYPIASVLLSKGAGFGVIFALISGEVICESVIRDLVEIKYFGIKFFSVRLILSTLFVIAGGFLIEFLL